MSGDDIIREALIARITALGQEVTVLEGRIEEIKEVTSDLARVVNNSMSLFSEDRQPEYRELVTRANRIRHEH